MKVASISKVKLFRRWIPAPYRIQMLRGKNFMKWWMYRDFPTWIFGSSSKNQRYRILPISNIYSSQSVSQSACPVYVHANANAFPLSTLSLPCVCVAFFSSFFAFRSFNFPLVLFCDLCSVFLRFSCSIYCYDSHSSLSFLQIRPFPLPFSSITYPSRYQAPSPFSFSLWWPSRRLFLDVTSSDC